MITAPTKSALIADEILYVYSSIIIATIGLYIFASISSYVISHARHIYEYITSIAKFDSSIHEKIIGIIANKEHDISVIQLLLDAGIQLDKLMCYNVVAMMKHLDINFIKPLADAGVKFNESNMHCIKDMILDCILK